VLKVRLKFDYRGVLELLCYSADLCRCIGLTKVPHWTTLQKNAERLPAGPGTWHVCAVRAKDHVDRAVAPAI